MMFMLHAPIRTRYEIMEIKHGRAAMLGFLHVIAIEVHK